jgi:hypothetical protein
MGAVEDIVNVAAGLIAAHPAVKSVTFAGSRSRGTHEELSDWDFAVDASDFEALARDLPALVAPLDPLGQQWEPMGHFPVYQVLLRGPTKIEYLFLDRSQTPRPPLQPSRETLPAINTHFWDWIWWLTTKASIGRRDLVAEHLPQLFTQLLRPMGVGARTRDHPIRDRGFHPSPQRAGAAIRRFGGQSTRERGASGNRSRSARVGATSRPRPVNPSNPKGACSASGSANCSINRARLSRFATRCRHPVHRQ